MHRRHLDVVANHVVVPDFQRGHAARGPVLGFEAGHRLAAVVAQRALFVELGPVALAHEAAVAHQQWRLVGQCLGERRDGVAMAGAAQDDLGERRRRRQQGLGLGAQRVRQRLTQIQPVAQGGEVARAAAADRQALQGAFDIRHASQRLAHAIAHRRPFDEELHQVEPTFDLGPVGQGRGDALGQQARARAGQGAVDGGEQAAIAPPVEALHQLEVAARRRVDLHRAVGPLAARRHQGRALAGLGQLDIVEQRAAGCHLGAREGTETVEHGDVERRLQPLAGVVAVEPRRGQRRQDGVPFLQRRLERLARQQPIGHQQFARRQAGQRGGDLAGEQRLGREVGRREIEPGQRQLALGLGQGREVVMAARVEQRVLGQGAGRDDAHHGTLDHRLGATFLGLGRVLDLFADRDLEALADQARQIGLVAVHRHAAHLDVFTQMLAALGQRDVERRRGLHRVVEEQLVEIAHPVEHQMVRMRGLDRQILAHHRRGVGGNGGTVRH